MKRNKKLNDVNVKTFTGNTAGGGSATNETGLTFEEYIDNVFSNQISKSENISLDGNKIIKDGKVYASRYSKHKLYNMLCVELGIKWKEILSKKLLPDDAILVHDTNTIYIVEKKYQKSSGSNDEKIQTAPYKILQYNMLFEGTGIKVDFCYVLSDWFKIENNPSYRNMLKYLDDHKVKYYYNELPLNHIGL